MARKVTSKKYKAVKACKAKRNSYPSDMYNPREDQQGVSAYYNSTVNKSDRSSFAEVRTPIKMNPTGRVTRGGIT